MNRTPAAAASLLLFLSSISCKGPADGLPLIITCMAREAMRKYPQLIGRIPAAMQRTASTKPQDNQRRVMTTSSKVRILYKTSIVKH
ncbi:unnamed protein product [Sphagnum jensenii]|uniref:Secreted protein n=1 Tax=Sphagnum jensenii TaxID=128206 RepID=A0ABP0VQM4_9BRYO